MNIVKIAAGDQEFEQGFFQLAYDKLQGKLYNLLPFLVGFQLVKKSQDGTKAVGVFGFKSNNGQIIFVPAFFANGKIKEMDIMYSRNNNQFYPLSEDFAELFLKDDVTGIGTPADESKANITKTIGNMNMRDVIYPPRTGRITYAEAKDLEEKNEEAFDKMGSMMEPKAYPTSPSLIEFVKEGSNDVKEAFWYLLTKRADFVDAVHQFYSDEELADALRVPPVVPEVKEASVKVVEFDDVSTAKQLPETEKVKIAREGYTILDKRAEEDKSKVGTFKFTETFSNPNKTGFYPYITEIGTIRYGLIIVQPVGLIPGFGSSSKVMVVDLEAKEPGRTYECETKDVFIKDHIEVKDISKALSVLEEPAESLPSYDDYVLINENLVATEPFRVIENFKDASGIRRIKVEPTWYAEASVNSGEKIKKKGKDSVAVLVLTKRTGDKLEFRNNAVYVPKGFKLLKINFSTYYSPSVDWSLPEAERKKKQEENKAEQARIRAGKPGGLYCLNSFLRENNTFPLTIHTNGNEYFLNIAGAKAKYQNPVEAKIAMVTEVGLSEKNAEELLRDLVPNTKRAGYIKLAVTGDSTLRLVDEDPSTNELGQPTYYGVPWIDQQDRSDGYTNDPTELGLGVKPDVQGLNYTVDKAVDLAQNGQKEVFDTQAISALSRYADTSTKVLEYVPNFVSSLDKLGRMLFLAYWDTEKFEKMYGKDELPELMELIKNVFNNLGDLIIFMKRKVPDISINTNDQSQIEQ